MKILLETEEKKPGNCLKCIDKYKKVFECKVITGCTFEEMYKGIHPDCPIQEQSQLSTSDDCLIWSIREFEIIPATKNSCATYQLLVDYNGVKILQTDEYSDRGSVWAKDTKERLGEMINILNLNQLSPLSDVNEMRFAPTLQIAAQQLREAAAAVIEIARLYKEELQSKPQLPGEEEILEADYNLGNICAKTGTVHNSRSFQRGAEWMRDQVKEQHPAPELPSEFYEEKLAKEIGEMTDEEFEKNCAEFPGQSKTKT
jgi:hypothetical protein